MVINLKPPKGYRPIYEGPFEDGDMFIESGEAWTVLKDSRNANVNWFGGIQDYLKNLKSMNTPCGVARKIQPPKGYELFFEGEIVEGDLFMNFAGEWGKVTGDIGYDASAKKFVGLPHARPTQESARTQAKAIKHDYGETW